MPQLWGARNEILKGQVGLNSIWKVNPLGGLLTRSLTKVASRTQGHVMSICSLKEMNREKFGFFFNLFRETQVSRSSSYAEYFITWNSS